MFQTILHAIAPIFIVLGLGYYCGWKKIADNKNINVLNVFVMRFSLPAALLTTAWNTPLTGFIKEFPLIVTLVTSGWFFWFLVYYIARFWFKKKPAAASIYALTVSLPNFAALGFPILEQTMPSGSGVTLNVSISIACAAIFLAPLTLMVLEKETRPEYKNRSMISLILPLLFTALKNPIVLWPIIGTILSCVGVTMPLLLDNSLKPLALAGGGGALFLTGLIISARKLKITQAIILGVVIKNLLQPLFVYFIATLLGLPAGVIANAVYLSALAIGFFSVMFGSSLGIQDEDAEGALLLSTLLFPLTIPIFMLILN